MIGNFKRGNHESNIEFLQKVDLLRKDKDILEIGSGLGVMLKYLRENGYQAKGIDTNGDYIIQAKNNFDLDIEKTRGDQLNFSNDSFDIILSFDVFEHIPNSNEHLAEVKRVLKNDGCYLLQTPNKLFNVPFEIFKERNLTSYKKYHCSLHHYWGLISRFKKAGFSVSFEDVPVVNDHFRAKVLKHFGKIGIRTIDLINPDKMPLWLRTNFYVIAQVKK